MLGKPYRKKINEQGWLKFINNESNPSQTWHRIETRAGTAIRDLQLLNESLPQYKKNEIFNAKNLKPLFDTLFTENNLSDYNQLESSAYVLKKTIRIFKNTHSYRNRNTLELANVINDSLDKAVGLCNDIAYREKINSLEKDSKDFKYLCNWRDILNTEKTNLLDFLSYAMFYEVEDLRLHAEPQDNKITGHFIDPRNGGMKYNLELSLFDEEGRAELLVSDDEENVSIQEFEVRTKNNDNLLYYGQPII